MIEKDFDISFVAQLAQREKQIQQSYRPIIGVHKWFARRPGTLFRALLLAEFTNAESLPARYFKSHNLHPRIVGDPFVGGGSPLLEANRLGCHVVGTDINPMAYWVVRQEITHLDRQAFRDTAQQVIDDVHVQLGELYETTCAYCGNPHAPVKYFLWVKTQNCSACQKTIDLFSKYLLAKNQRHPNYVLVCPSCGSLDQIAELNKTPGKMKCGTCGDQLLVKGPARRGQCQCPHCGHTNHYPTPEQGPPQHRLFALEYHCPTCKPKHRGRFFKAPDAADIARLIQAKERLARVDQRYIPTEKIPAGDETDRLHRWGYETYRQLFNSRQRYGLATLANTIAQVQDEAVRHALLTVFSDTLRYQNMVCRYDSYALKIIDVFSIHGFPVSLVQCENSLLGIPGVGSGGFRHFVKKYDRAKRYCEKPFETVLSHPKRKVFLSDEKIEAQLTSEFPHSQEPRSAYLRAASADTLIMPSNSLDAVLTDPPYFANVQYAELMDFCYVWLKRHLESNIHGFQKASTRSDQELTINQTEGRGIVHFTTGLSQIFKSFTQALKPGGPFAFTYHHNDPEAYLPIAVALLDAGLVCTVTLPCPAEMGASIHISGTRSSVMDTIFVCRTTGTISAKAFDTSAENIKLLLEKDLKKLQLAKLTPTAGDAYCILLGHLTRLAIWTLCPTWRKEMPVKDKLERVKATLQQIYPLDLIEQMAQKVISSLSDLDPLAAMRVKEGTDHYDEQDEISF
jgi:putative DNA methylase